MFTKMDQRNDLGSGVTTVRGGEGEGRQQRCVDFGLVRLRTQIRKTFFGSADWQRIVFLDEYIIVPPPLYRWGH